MPISSPTESEVDPVRIRAVAASVGESIEPSTMQALVVFGKLFMTWNQRVNLSGVATPEELVDGHFVDALAACRYVAPNDRVVDVGSGGGLPVIPMALLNRQARFELYEATAKKAAFLRTAVRELGMGDRVRVHWSRLDLPVSPPIVEGFDVACSRATFPPALWLALGRSLVRPGGRVLVFATAAPAPGCPPPVQEFNYAPNRRLLVFDR